MINRLMERFAKVRIDEPYKLFIPWGAADPSLEWNDQHNMWRPIIFPVYVIDDEAEYALPYDNISTLSMGGNVG